MLRNDIVTGAVGAGRMLAMITLCGFGVSNYYNKLKLVMLEKQVPFSEKLIYPWQRESFLHHSPLGKIPFIETEHGGLSESQVILDYLEERYTGIPLYPTSIFERAKCRELIQHLELNAEWVARRLYKEVFFGGHVSDEVKRDVRDRLSLGLEALSRISEFSPFIMGNTFTAADCVAYVHFVMIEQATQKIYDENMLSRLLPKAAKYMDSMATRPHVQTVMTDRAHAIEAFFKLNVKYDG
jgi:glutathione S-transferase